MINLLENNTVQVYTVHWCTVNTVDQAVEWADFGTFQKIFVAVPIPLTLKIDFEAFFSELGNRTFAHSHIALFRSLKNVQMCNHTFFCSLKMWECVITHFVALWKCVKKCKFWNCTFCTLKRSHNSSFKKGKCAKICKKSNFWIAQFLLLKKGDCTFSMTPLIKVQKSNFKICTF